MEQRLANNTADLTPATINPRRMSVRVPLLSNRRRKPSKGRVPTRHYPDPDYIGFCWCGLPVDRCRELRSSTLQVASRVK